MISFIHRQSMIQLQSGDYQIIRRNPFSWIFQANTFRPSWLMEMEMSFRLSANIVTDVSRKSNRIQWGKSSQNELKPRMETFAMGQGERDRGDRG